MGSLSSFARDRVRDMRLKRGRMNRPRFILNFNCIFLIGITYLFLLDTLVDLLDLYGAPWAAYTYPRHFGMGIFFLALAFATRRLRLRRLRDIGWSAILDMPVMLLLIALGIGAAGVFVPWLKEANVFLMRPEIRDFCGIMLIGWLLVLILMPGRYKHPTICDEEPCEVVRRW